MAPGAANLHFPRAGLSSGQRNQPTQARTRPAEPAGPQRPLDPRQRGWAWAPPATAPPTRTPEKREPHPRRRLRTYLQGTVRLLDSGRGPEGRAPRRPGARPPGPLATLGIRDGAGRGQTPGGCGRPARPDAGSRGPGSPSAPGHRCRRHFAFHSVSPPPPPPPSAAGFPDVGISRRRLRGGRGLGASGRPAGPGSERSACGLLTEARSPAARSRGECRPESGVCTTTFWLRTETRPRARRGKRGSHQEDRGRHEARCIGVE